MSIFYCPECNSKIKDKNYDETYEMYECPGCEGLWQFHELVENGAQSAAGNGNAGSLDARRGPEKKKANGKPSRNGKGQDRRVRPGVIAKAKKRAAELQDDEDAAQQQIEEMVKGAKPQKKEERHRDEIDTGLVLNVIADEIEAICEEAGISMNRLNAREFYAMNLYRPLILAGVRAREIDVPHKLCKEHS